MKNNVTIGHGSGGKLSRKLIRDIFMPYLSNQYLEQEDDGAQVNMNSTRIVFSTDAFTVTPLIFPGGDIAKLAVCGTVNDLVVSGAVPRFLSASFVIEEGFSIEMLEQFAKSFSKECRKAGVELVAADTKVVEHGKADGIFISVSGIGDMLPLVELVPERVKKGDRVIVSGDIGDHGAAILLARGQLNIQADISSDCACLDQLILTILRKYPTAVKLMRDATRGGVATVLNELATRASVDILLDEQSLPIKGQVKALCEMLGLNPLYLANEGKAILFVDGDYTDATLDLLQNDPLGRKASVIGEVLSDTNGRVFLKTLTRGKRILHSLIEDQLPRIC